MLLHSSKLGQIWLECPNLDKKLLSVKVLKPSKVFPIKVAPSRSIDRKQGTISLKIPPSAYSIFSSYRSLYPTKLTLLLLSPFRPQCHILTLHSLPGWTSEISKSHIIGYYHQHEIILNRLWEIIGGIKKTYVYASFGYNCNVAQYIFYDITEE